MRFLAKMGALLSRFRTQPSTIEELERIDKEIESLLRLKRRDGELEKQYVGTLVLYSVIVYLIMALAFYFYFVPEDWTGRAIQILPLLSFPFLIWLARRMIKFYFTRRVSKSDMLLSDLRAEKKKILEEVKEKESYKKAKEILEKYDPASVSPPPPPTPVAAPMSRSPPGGVTPILRQRMPPSGGGTRGRGRGRGTPMVLNRGTPMVTPRTSQFSTPMAGRGQPIARPPSTVRPILQQERGTVDKLVDYLVGDGPGNRFALICRHCYSHNGMALQEEFEYLAFRCPYCGTFNPARKVRPNAPKLESAPSSSAEQASSGSSSEGQSDHEGGTPMLSAPSDGTSASPGVPASSTDTPGGDQTQTAQLADLSNDVGDLEALAGEAEPLDETAEAVTEVGAIETAGEVSNMQAGLDITGVAGEETNPDANQEQDNS